MKRKICVISLGIFLFLVLYAVSCISGFYAAVIGISETEIEIIVTDSYRKPSASSPAYYKHMGHDCNCLIRDGLRLSVFKNDISDDIYQSLKIGDEIRIRYYFDSDPQPFDPTFVDNIISVERISVAHSVFDWTIEEVGIQKNIYQEIRNYVDTFQSETLDANMCMFKVPEENIGYLFYYYETDSGEKSISLLIETPQENTVQREVEEYSDIDIQVVAGKETLVLMKNFACDPRYISLEK